MMPQNPSSSRCVESGDIFCARRYINENFADELSLPALAKIANVSPNHLSEKFRQVTGINFVAYIARTRFEKACALLRDPHLRVSEIAFAVGFQSLSQFNRVFKKFSGKSPTEYRASACQTETAPTSANCRKLAPKFCQ
jgi:AraC-like DNA-binding protein